MSVKQVSVRMLRPRLAKVLGDVSGRLDRYIVTRRGRPEAVIMSLLDYESLLETLDVEQDSKTMARLKQAERELTAGKGKTLEEIEKDLGLV